MKKKGAKPPPPKYDRRTAVKIKPGVRVQFKLRTLSLIVKDIFGGNPSANEMLQRVGAFLALKTFKLSTFLKFSFESDRKGKDELLNKMVDISICNCGTIGARISSAISDKLEETLENRDHGLDRDPENYHLNPHMVIDIHTADLIFIVQEVWRLKEKISSEKEKYMDSYSHQGILDYRSTRQDLYYLLLLDREAYMTLLPAALFKPNSS